MNQLKKRGVSLLLALCLLMSLSVTAFAADSKLDAALNDAAKYVYQTVKEPQVGSVGGEWAVVGLARSGYKVPGSYYQEYYKVVEECVRSYKGVLDGRKYTEYSRVIVALSAIGMDARNVAGYDLTVPLGDYDKTIWQGINGPIWALIALDSRNYPMPKNPTAKTQATRQMYIDRILECQLPDGGWSLFGGTAAASSGDGVSDPDITGMAFQALAKYQDQPAVAKATQEALECMSKKQNAQTAGFGSSWDAATSESCVQMVVGLAELGISLDDPRFVKNGRNLLDALLDYYTSGKGFKHVLGYGSDAMASEQGLYGLAAIKRLQDGANSLYRMSDAISIDKPQTDKPTADQGLAGKNPAVKVVPVVTPGKTFPDVNAAVCKETAAIEAMTARGIINGRDDGKFYPQDSMTRAAFSAIMVRGLGLTPAANNAFKDVTADNRLAGHIGTAYSFGIIQGLGDGRFNPTGTITRQAAAVMVARAAKLCGLDTSMDKTAIRDVLAQFPDYTKTAEVMREGVAFCYSSGILDQNDMEIRPLEPVKRAEVAQMLYNMLEKANLL